MKMVKYNHRRPGFFNPFFDDFFTRDVFLNERNGESGTKRFPTNIRQTDTAFELELSAPGFAKAEFNLELDEHTLTIQAQHEAKDEQSPGGYYRREFGATSLKRAFTLPDSVDGEAIEAKFENGVLYVTLPKKEQEVAAPARHIQVG